MPLDIVDMTEDINYYKPSPDPYGHLLPFTLPGENFVLGKNNVLFFLRWDRVNSHQYWTVTPSIAFRFADRRIAYEFARFLDAESSRREGETRILIVTALPEPISRVSETLFVLGEDRNDLKKWLTTYSGIKGEKS